LQTFAADAFRGQRLCMSAYVKSEDVGAGAGLLMRIDGPGGMLAIHNMQEDPIRGTTGWARYDIVMDVPVDGLAIVFGPWLSGPGQIAFDDFEFEAVGPEVPLTPNGE
jgi:hypothetical protein